MMKEFSVSIGISVLLISFYLFFYIFEWPLETLALNPKGVIYLGDWYRLISAHLSHVDLEHIVFNVGAVLGEGIILEQRHGSEMLLIVSLWSMLLISSLYVVTAHMLDSVSGQHYWLVEDIQGFSGVLFHWTVWASCSEEGEFTDMGLGKHFVPWVSLLSLYAYEPDNDLGFLGHLCGIIVGYLHVYGYLDSILPKDARSAMKFPKGFGATAYKTTKQRSRKLKKS